MDAIGKEILKKQFWVANEGIKFMVLINKLLKRTQWEEKACVSHYLRKGGY